MLELRESASMQCAKTQTGLKLQISNLEQRKGEWDLFGQIYTGQLFGSSNSGCGCLQQGFTKSLLRQNSRGVHWAGGRGGGSLWTVDLDVTNKRCKLLKTKRVNDLGKKRTIFY